MISKLKNAWRVWLAALMFYTRIPVPNIADYHPDLLAKSRAFFPLIGLLVGTVGAAILFFTADFMPASIAVILSMISTILLTGAFHEDGLADSFDAFGGGWQKQQVLTIMKDSRLGSYGAIALIMVLLLKFQLLLTILNHNVWLIVTTVIFAHIFSRYCASLVVDFLPYVQDIDQSKIKPIANQKLSYIVQFACLIFILFALLVIGLNQISLFVWASFSAALISVLFAYYSFKRIGGYTGDVLGACQQLSEVVFYLAIVICVS